MGLSKEQKEKQEAILRDQCEMLEQFRRFDKGIILPRRKFCPLFEITSFTPPNSSDTGTNEEDSLPDLTDIEIDD